MSEIHVENMTHEEGERTEPLRNFKITSQFNNCLLCIDESKKQNLRVCHPFLIKMRRMMHVLYFQYEMVIRRTCSSAPHFDCRF